MPASSELVDPDFLAFFTASHPSAASAITQQATLYTELQAYGWTLEQLCTAAKTGYRYAAHAAPSPGETYHLT